MKTIFKYVIHHGEDTMMPAGAEILTVQIQNGLICAWAAVNVYAPLVKRKIIALGTGHTFSEAEYLATVQDGAFVWHLFEVKS